MHSPSFYDRHYLKVADARANYHEAGHVYRMLQRDGLQARLQDCVEAFGAIIEVHKRSADGHNCVVCRTVYPCPTLRLIPDGARGAVDLYPRSTD